MQRSNDLTRQQHLGQDDFVHAGTTNTEIRPTPSGVDLSPTQRQHLQPLETQMPEASVMRAGAPLGSDPLQRSEYQIASESIGGTAHPFDKGRLEVAKGHLVEAMKDVRIDKTKRSETKNHKDHLNDVASMDSARYNSTAAPKESTASTTILPHRQTPTGLSSDSDRLGELNALGGGSNATNTRSDDLTAGNTGDHMIHSAEHGIVGGPHMPASMKGHQVSTAAVMGATSAIFPAPPVNDSVISTTDIPPTAPGQAVPEGEQHDAKDEGQHHIPLTGFHFKTRRLSMNRNPETEHKTEKQAVTVGSIGANTSETKTATEGEHHSLAEKIKNVFRRQSSADKAKDHLTGSSESFNPTKPEARTHSNEYHKSSSGSRNNRDTTAASASAPVLGAATAVGASNHGSTFDHGAGDKSSTQHHANVMGGVLPATTIMATTLTNPFPASSAPKNGHFKGPDERQESTISAEDRPSNTNGGGESNLTGNGNLMADLHAAPGIPATKVDVQPTTTFNDGHNSTMPPRTNTNGSSTAAPPGRRPSLAEKIVAPVVGAANYFGQKATTAKEAMKGSFHSSSSADQEGGIAKGTAATGSKSTFVDTNTEPSLKGKISAPLAGTGVTLGTEGLAGYKPMAERETYQDMSRAVLETPQSEGTNPKDGQVILDHTGQTKEQALPYQDSSNIFKSS